MHPRPRKRRHSRAFQGVAVAAHAARPGTFRCTRTPAAYCGTRRSISSSTTCFLVDELLELATDLATAVQAAVAKVDDECSAVGMIQGSVASEVMKGKALARS